MFAITNANFTLPSNEFIAELEPAVVDAEAAVSGARDGLLTQSEANAQGLVFQDFDGDDYMNAEELAFKPENNFLPMGDAWKRHENEKGIDPGYSEPSFAFHNFDAAITLACDANAASDLIAGAEEKSPGAVDGKVSAQEAADGGIAFHDLDQDGLMTADELRQSPADFAESVRPGSVSDAKIDAAINKSIEKIKHEMVEDGGVVKVTQCGALETFINNLAGSGNATAASLLASLKDGQFDAAEAAQMNGLLAQQTTQYLSSPGWV